MTDYEFQIVQGHHHRYLWTLVQKENGKHRVLARSHRDYRTKQKVRDAIGKVRLAVAAAKIVDNSSFTLPDTEFEIHSGNTIPLLVGGRRDSLSESTGT